MSRHWLRSVHKSGVFVQNMIENTPESLALERPVALPLVCWADRKSIQDLHG